MNINELCKGCNAFEGCLIKYHEPFIELCPCLECLVKMACTEQCLEREDLYDDIPDYDKVMYMRKNKRTKEKEYT